MEHRGNGVREVVERILFLHAKLNPGQGYVQGMNDIIGPIHYTFAIDTNEEYRTEECNLDLARSRSSEICVQEEPPRRFCVKQETSAALPAYGRRRHT